MNWFKEHYGRVLVTLFGLITAGGSVAQSVDSGDHVELTEIVVTAEKVESTVQRTPIAIQTVSNGELIGQGIQNTQDLTRIVPGLSVTETGGGSSFFIRGVGTYNETSASDSGLALSLDEMYFSRPYGPDLALYDVERVEVLKGPQGTLYGRNSTGGSVNIISKKPVIGEFSSDDSVEFGNYNELKVNGAVNLPISSTLAARVAFQTNRHDGYLQDGYDDANTDAARVHLLWQPSEDTSLLLTGEYMHNGQKGPGDEPYPNYRYLGSPFSGGATPANRAYVDSVSSPVASSVTNATFANGAYVPSPYNCLPGCNQVAYFAPSVQPGPLNTEENGFVNITVSSFRARFDQNLNFATLSVIPTDLLTSAKTLYYNSGTAIYSTSNDHQSSFEARLASHQDQPFTWIGGLFYLHEKQAYDSFNAGGFPNLVTYVLNPDVQTTSEAAFGQVDYKIIDTVRATLGYRYTKERKWSDDAVSGGEGYLPAGAPGPPPGFTPPTSTYDNSSASTYRAGLDWDVTPSNLLYASYSTGFHAGGFNSGATQVQPICTPSPNDSPAQLVAAFNPGCDVNIFFKPEHLDAIAVGSKNRFLGNTLQVNVELYDWKYKDLQAFSLEPTNVGGGVKAATLFTTNAGDAKIRGVDLDVLWLATPDDRLSLTYNYNHSAYGNYVTYFVIPNAPIPPFISNYSGKPFLNAPDSVLHAGYDHTFALPNGGHIVPALDVKYSSKIIYDYAPDFVQGGYVKTNLYLGYRAPKDVWSVNAYVRNVSDKATIVRAIGSAPATGVPWVYVDAPRTYGVVIEAKF